MDAEAHFHIRWASGEQDWERHNTWAEAEEAAERLARFGEEYAIEKCNETGGMCARAAYVKPEGKSASA